MNIKTLGSLAIAALLLTACSNEEWLNTGTTKGVLTASVEGSYSSTRAGFDGGGNFYWSTVDHIGVTTTGNESSFTSLGLTSGGGTGSATFSGTISGEIGSYAVYPYNSYHTIDGNGLVYYNFPASYTYDKVDTDFFTATQGEGNSFNPAMFGKIENGSVTLKHLGGVICIKIEKMPVAEGTLKLTADKRIANKFEVKKSADGQMECSTGVGTGKTVTITFSGATKDSSGVFYVPVPTGTYSLNIKVYDGNDQTDGNRKIDVNAGTYTISRCDLKKIELKEVSVDATASTLDAAEEKLKNDAVVSVEENITENKEITIPAVDNSTEPSSKSLSLQNVATGASLTVTDGSTGGTNNSVKDFTLAIPNNESATVEDLLDVTITMPNTTVTLAGNGGSARYGRVAAETAANTLVIGSDVEVANVVVFKGNVRVKKGAMLTAISKGEGNTAKVTIYKEEGATIPEGLGDGFEVVDVINDADVAAEEELQRVAKEGGSYYLKNDIVLSSPLVVEKDMRRRMAAVQR